MQLLDFFTGKFSWGRLYALLEQMGPWTRYKSALAMDEVYARRICDMEDAGMDTPAGASSGDGEPLVEPAGYTPVIARLDLILDRLMGVRTAVQAGYSKDHKEPKWTPLPRPSTAIERERERRTLDELSAIADSMFMPAGEPYA